MRAFALPIAVGLFCCTRAFCADFSGVFPDLAKLELKDERVRVWYPKDHAKPVATLPVWKKDYEEAGVYASAPLVLELGHGLPPLALACDSGPSNDPSCRLLTNRDDPATSLFESPGTDFAFLPSGEIYASGATDYTYDHRRLFRYDGKRFTEVAQPFRYRMGVAGRGRLPIRRIYGSGGLRRLRGYAGTGLTNQIPERGRFHPYRRRGGMGGKPPPLKAGSQEGRVGGLHTAWTPGAG